MFIKTYHSEFRELCRIILKARGTRLHQENSVFYAILGLCTTHMNFQILCQLVPGLLTFKLDGFPSLRGEVDMNFHPYPSHYCQVTATCKGRFYFLQWCLSRGVSRRNKLSSILEDVLSHIVFYGIIVLIFLDFYCSLWFPFCVCVFECVWGVFHMLSLFLFFLVYLLKTEGKTEFISWEGAEDLGVDERGEID